MNDHFSDTPLYNIGVVARMTGIPITTLHAWDRRYQFPVSSRTAGGHRLFSEKDVSRLRWVKSQLNSGLSISQAVLTLRALEAEERFPFQDPNAPSIAPPGGVSFQQGSNGTAPFESKQASLLSALTNHDLLQADQLISDMLACCSIEEITLQVIGPVMNAVGEGWLSGQVSIATEHLATNYLRQRLLMWMVTGSTLHGADPIVLACAPGEWHEGSLLMLGVLLRRRGWAVAYLGQNVPLPELGSIVNRLHPPAVILVAMMDESAQNLAGWPRWIVQTDGKPLVAYGGRVLLYHPEHQNTIPGVYLGDTIQDGFNRLLLMLEAV